MDPIDLTIEKNRTKKALRRRLRNVQKALEENKKNLLQAKNYKETEHIGELLKTYFYKLSKGQSSITLEDWENNEKKTISLFPLKTPEEQLKYYFKKAKKEKKSLPYLEQNILSFTNLKAALEEVLTHIDVLEDLHSLKKVQEKQHLFRKKEHHPAEIKQPFLVFLSESGNKIFVGRNAEENHLLTFQMAKKDDLWLHIARIPGSHILIKKTTASIDNETVLDALQLAIYHSKARGQKQKEHIVHVTERKNISRKKSSPKGLALLRDYTEHVVLFDPERINAIKKRPYSPLNR